jgi:hypothetical protein
MGTHAGGAAVAPVSPSVGTYLAALERRWPVGTRVRHAGSGWLGTVTADTSGQAPGITVGSDVGPGAAHGLLFEPPYGRRVPAVVCVAWDRAEAGRVAWMRLEQLRHLNDPREETEDRASQGTGGGPDPHRRRVRTRRLGGRR